MRIYLAAPMDASASDGAKKRLDALRRDALDVIASMPNVHVVYRPDHAWQVMHTISGELDLKSKASLAYILDVNEEAVKQSHVLLIVLPNDAHTFGCFAEIIEAKNNADVPAIVLFSDGESRYRKSLYALVYDVEFARDRGELRQVLDLIDGSGEDAKL